jgi:hypothetical protein
MEQGCGWSRGVDAAETGLEALAKKGHGSGMAGAAGCVCCRVW